SPKGNNAGEIFRQSAQALSTSRHNAVGAFIRRLKGKKGAPVAIRLEPEKLLSHFTTPLRAVWIMWRPVL
ncbi:MAG: hypothetical protein LBB73_06965, partial [Dysgonamonadaceae bacterium]|nr:hypothetical protein [Dysgonamonadaceae bacterium]